MGAARTAVNPGTATEGSGAAPAATIAVASGAAAPNGMIAAVVSGADRTARGRATGVGSGVMTGAIRVGPAVTIVVVSAAIRIVPAAMTAVASVAVTTGAERATAVPGAMIRGARIVRAVSGVTTVDGTRPVKVIARIMTERRGAAIAAVPSVPTATTAGVRSPVAVPIAPTAVTGTVAADLTAIAIAATVLMGIGIVATVLMATGIVATVLMATGIVATVPMAIGTAATAPMAIGIVATAPTATATEAIATVVFVAMTPIAGQRAGAPGARAARALPRTAAAAARAHNLPVDPAVAIAGRRVPRSRRFRTTCSRRIWNRAYGATCSAWTRATPKPLHAIW
ncbi:hypothetical protein ABIA39_002069 [Nocardia sp. GAS34]